MEGGTPGSPGEVAGRECRRREEEQETGKGVGLAPGAVGRAHISGEEQEQGGCGPERHRNAQVLRQSTGLQSWARAWGPTKSGRGRYHQHEEQIQVASLGGPVGAGGTQGELLWEHFLPASRGRPGDVALDVRQPEGRKGWSEFLGSCV